MLRNISNFFFSDIYRTNMFHLSSIGCALVLQKDLEYWGIDELMMEPCCALKYYPEIEICVNEKQVLKYILIVKYKYNSSFSTQLVQFTVTVTGSPLLKPWNSVSTSYTAVLSEGGYVIWLAGNRAGPESFHGALESLKYSKASGWTSKGAISMELVKNITCAFWM